MEKVQSNYRCAGDNDSNALCKGERIPKRKADYF